MRSEASEHMSSYFRVAQFPVDAGINVNLTGSAHSVLLVLWSDLCRLRLMSQAFSFIVGSCCVQLHAIL